MRKLMARLFEQQTLSRSEAKSVMLDLVNPGKSNHSQIASFLTVFCMRNITVAELEGFRDAMLERCLHVDLGMYDPIDLCGTGGDGKDTFNISTCAAFVVAGSGVKVAKHGNNGVSSVCGSSNVLQHIGIRFTNDCSRLQKQIEEAHICYLHAPLFHPAMKHVAPVRRELGMRTFFNMLGPLVNPSRPKRQLLGVFNLELARLYNYLFQRSEQSYRIVHSLDGYDEISLTGAFKMYSNQEECIRTPASLGLPTVTEASLFGGDTIESAASHFIEILSGNGTVEQNAVVCANAGMAIHCARPELNLEDSILQASETLKSGKALSSLNQFIQLSQ